MLVTLSREYSSRDGVPIINRVDQAIFVRTYFTHCMSCNFCKDFCCSFGVGVDIQNIRRLESYADKLEAYTGISRDKWFAGKHTADCEFPGEIYTRTQLIDGACVFLNRKGRGCMIHRFCVEAGIDYHVLKPMICSLFPVTFDQGLLYPSEEADDNTLVCLNTGSTLYRGIREDLRYYFGDDLIHEFDRIESEICSVNG
jgi:Predicted Fe-S-cluster oxidoreductase